MIIQVKTKKQARSSVSGTLFPTLIPSKLSSCFLEFGLMHRTKWEELDSNSAKSWKRALENKRMEKSQILSSNIFSTLFSEALNLDTTVGAFFLLCVVWLS
jgi:hypothetical protein